MAFRTIRVALLLTALPAAGCGTAVNLVRPGPEGGGKAPFGGVKQDLWAMQKAANGGFGSRTDCKSEAGQYPQVALAALYAADVPLSLIGDLVTWPYVAAYTLINQPIPTPPMTLLPPELPPPPQTPPGEPLAMPRKLPDNAPPAPAPGK